MTVVRGFACFIRALFFWAVLGLAVIFLSGPVLAVLSVGLSLGLAMFAVLFPFAVVGLLFWLPVRLMRHGRRAAWQDVRETSHRVGRLSFSGPAKNCVRVVSGARHVAVEVRERAHGTTCLLRGIVVEVSCGAIVGLLPGLIMWTRQSEPEWLPLFGSLGGAMLGGLVGISRFRIQSGDAAILHS